MHKQIFPHSAVIRWGVHSGNFCMAWIRELVAQKLGDPDATFRTQFESTGIGLYLCATNIGTGYVEVFSHEHTPDVTVAEAVRMSMSIPIFFEPWKRRGSDGSTGVYVDGGIGRNFPIRLFDYERYLVKPQSLDSISNRERLVCNPETLGFRLDSSEEISILRDSESPVPKQISTIYDYTKVIIAALLSAQENQHRNSNDWARTVYVDTLGVGATDFSISDEVKLKLIEAGRGAVLDHFANKVEPEVLLTV